MEATGHGHRRMEPHSRRFHRPFLGPEGTGPRFLDPPLSNHRFPPHPMAPSRRGPRKFRATGPGQARRARGGAPGRAAHPGLGGLSLPARVGRTPPPEARPDLTCQVGIPRARGLPAPPRPRSLAGEPQGARLRLPAGGSRRLRRTFRYSTSEKTARAAALAEARGQVLGPQAAVARPWASRRSARRATGSDASSSTCPATVSPLE